MAGRLCEGHSYRCARYAHGTWADASSWNAVATPLQDQGFTVLAPTNLLRGPATDSLAASIEVSRRVGPQGADLVEVSRTAFLHAMQSSLYVMAGIVAVAAVVIGLWSPGRDGTRLSPLWWPRGTAARRP